MHKTLGRKGCEEDATGVHKAILVPNEHIRKTAMYCIQTSRYLTLALSSSQELEDRKAIVPSRWSLVAQKGCLSIAIPAKPVPKGQIPKTLHTHQIFAITLLAVSENEHHCTLFAYNDSNNPPDSISQPKATLPDSHTEYSL